MMKHKWHKEIKAWADGAEIQIKYLEGAGSKSGWMVMSDPDWDCYDVEYRIKPQPKEPQYLYFYNAGGMVSCEKERLVGWDGVLLGKIKLEDL
jgi:hypothetical protein